MTRIAGAVLAVVVILSGCAQGEDTVTTGTIDTSPTSATDIGGGPAASTPDAASSSTSASGTEEPATDEPAAEGADPAVPTTSEPGEALAAPPTGTGSEEERTPEPAASATSGAHGADLCDTTVLSRDLVGAETGVVVVACEQGWVYGVYSEAEGDAEFIAQHSGGAWTQVSTLGSPTCREELQELGAPDAVVQDVLTCEEMAGGEDDEASVDCVIITDVYGPTNAVVKGLTCDAASAIWASAVGEPSWDTPSPAADGWECYAFPDDGEFDTAVAGTCDAPDFSASLVLYVTG